MKKHSVLLKEELCEGCTNCVKNCPTRAIRVHHGKATIKEDLCIDCAECIRTCAYHAKYSRADRLVDIEEFKYPVVLIPPSFYGQFDGIEPVKVKKSLYRLGFKDVRDVAQAAEALTRQTLLYLDNNTGMYISSSCPVVVRMIKIQYPELIGHLLPFKSPVEMMAEKARNELEESGISPEDIGIFFITPCPAKYTTIFNPMGIDKSNLDRALSVDVIYQALLKILDKKDAVNGTGTSNVKTNNIEIGDIEPGDLEKGDIEPGDIESSNAQTDNNEGKVVPYLGITWGQNATLSVSGIHNVKALLDELSRNNVKGIKYFELVGCSQGCVGGIFNVINPFQAKYNLRKLTEKHQNMIEQDYSKYNYQLSRDLKAIQIGSLDTNMERAMEKLILLEKEIDILPGLDCAACGAPDCKTLAEDIINGKAKRTDCIFVLRQQVGDLADRMSELAHALPPVMKEGKISGQKGKRGMKDQSS
ncbi:MAG: [Fe-Fe] hydrogenase large subunit C-terminal domain-containing protein [Halanaerobiales bacterium]